MIPDAINLSIQYLLLLPFIAVIAGIFTLLEKRKK
jgi:hypothetical protein